jgi:hypothetical protein
LLIKTIFKKVLYKKICGLMIECFLLLILLFIKIGGGISILKLASPLASPQ